MSNNILPDRDHLNTRSSSKVATRTVQSCYMRVVMMEKNVQGAPNFNI